MYAEILSKYLKKVKAFAWDNGPSPLYSNVLIKSLDNKKLLLACTDANVGIQQIITQIGDKPIQGECCVNVFDLSKIIDAIDKNSDLDIYLKDNKLIISDKKFKTTLKTMSSDQIFNIPKYNEWFDLDKNFVKELQSVLPPTDDLDAPIIYDTKKLFLGNPKSLYYLLTSKCQHSFSIDQKSIRKIFIDTFEQMCIVDGRLNLKNEHCRIFVPTFNGKPLALDPIIKQIETDYVNECKINVKELNYIYGILKEISEIEKHYDPKILVNINKNEFVINFYDSIFKINDFSFKSDIDITINIPITHIKHIIKNTFVNGSDIVSICLANNSRMFVCKSKNLFFVGGLYKV